MDDRTSDEELMARVAAGETQALGELFERYKQPVFNFLCRFLGNPTPAEDVVVETFLRVYDRRATYKRGQRFAGWLYAIAHNLAADQLRRAARHELPSDELENCPHGELPDDLLVRAELAEQVRAAILRLPPDQRVAIILREYQGFSFREIAEITGASEEAVRVRAHRARQALRATLAPIFRDTPTAV